MQRFINGARLTYVYSISQNKPHMIFQKIEKEIIMKKRPIYLLSLMLLGVFMIACDKNDNDTLTFDNQNVELFIDETTTVKVSGGAAPYTVKAADETIAEAFHDVYLNENNAKDASKYIVNVLKQKLEG